MASPEETVSQGQGAVERLTALAGLVTSLDRRVVEAFDSLARVGAASAELERITEETSDLVGDLRSRLDRLEARLYSDLDELKAAALERLGTLDKGRVEKMEESIQAIERAVTRLDSLVEGVVDTVPEFITRRVRGRAQRVEDAGFDVE